MSEPRENSLSFVDCFDEIVRSQPERVAIQVGDERDVTYRALQQQSLGVMELIRRSMLDGPILVGLRLEKSPELLSALIGVWRAGCAWVPIDPSLPESARQHVLKDARPQLVFSNRAEPGVLPVPCVPLGGTDRRPETRAVQPDDLAYVIYTSGTTGTPRGVAVNHSGIMNLLRAQTTAFEITPNSRCLWFYPPSFDASISDWGTALFAGATLLIEPGLTAASAEHVMARLQQRCVTHADLPPSLLSVLPEPEPGSSLQTIVIGGQATDAATVKRWATRLRLVNVYGPTEATVCTSLEVCAASRRKPLLGRPIAGVEYRVVDPDLQDVETSVPGELLISGDCLARGYLNQPELTRQRFVTLQGRRYYRTGDRVYREANGDFVFRGRIDRQQSVNGFRVEPEEIEAVLSSLPGVSRAAVVMRRLAPDSRRERLVAFVEVAEPLSPTQIRAELSVRLQRYKLPCRIVVQPRIPRTSAGKFDLHALRLLPLVPSPDVPSLMGEDAVRFQEVVKLFRQVTGEPRLGPDDRFQDWGGDSLASLRLASLAAERDLEFPLEVLADNPSPREVYQALRPAATRTAENSIDRLTYCGRVELLQADATNVLQTYVNDTNAEPRLSGAADGGVILLTGATGFLGARVLAELLSRSNPNVVCVLRGDEDGLRRRLERHLFVQEIDLPPGSAARISVVSGDVSERRFGIRPDAWRRFKGRVRAVVHCAADIGALSSYRALRDVNLLGTANALACARRFGAPLHYASTLSVFVGTDAHRGVYREDSPLRATVAYGGYAQTKLAAELLLQATSQPVPIHIHRFGLLVADVRSGVFPRNDILTMTVQGLQRLGCVPLLERDLRFDLTPVDYAAAAMTAIVTGEQPGREQGCATWHIAGRETATAQQLFQYLRRRAALAEVPFAEFRRRLLSSRSTFDQTCHELECLRMSFQRWMGDGDPNSSRPLDLFQSTEAVFDCEQTRRYLKSWGVDCPALTDDLLEAVFERMCHEPVAGNFG